MKKSDLKNLLKPLIKECIKETLLEEGVLSGIIFEVIKGTQPLLNNTHTKENINMRESQILEEKHEKLEHQKLMEQKWETDKEKRKKLLNATGFKGMNLFEGLEPIANEAAPGQSQGGPLADTDPKDQGVDISGILALGASKWKSLIK